MKIRRLLSTTSVVISIVSAATVLGQSVELRTQTQDPYGFPRPASGQTNVPLLTSYFFEVSVADQTDDVLPDSVTMRLTPQGQSAFYVLQTNQQFQPGYSGTLTPGGVTFSTLKMLGINIDSTVPLQPSKQYTVTLTATSTKGATFSGGQATYNFTTEPSPTTHTLTFSLDTTTSPTHWTGAFFTGFCQPSFCSSELYGRIPGYELMDQVRQSSPKAWSLIRPWSITGYQDSTPRFVPQPMPNLVRELETRRIDSITANAGGTELHVTDFWGHEQYGIPSDRALSLDYHPGDVILIADSDNSAQTTVTAVDDAASTLAVTTVSAPSGGWKIDYNAPPPTVEDPAVPGLFPAGGCYLRKFSPTGTPRYYWTRLDKEHDLHIQQFGRRVVANFCSAPQDLAVDGRNDTTAKDYVEMHQVAYDVTTHMLDRYGTACLDLVWSIGNEPDLGPLFWRTSWDEFQRFYDYTADGILRAFEDKGYDSSRVYIGGLEFAGVKTFGAAKSQIFFGHASPTAVYSGEISENAAYADPLLDGKRSQRITDLCSANGGKGTPIDFVSVHCYCRSDNAAEYMRWVKEKALAIDPVYFADLAVHTHESCPGWAPPPDVAANDSYLGNGYFTTWCADVTRRLLHQASLDPRYGFGESILTFWPFPNSNLNGLDDATQVLSVDSDNNGTVDYKVTIAAPIMNTLGLTCAMGDDFWVLPQKTQNGHIVSGFASRTGLEEYRVLLYSHEALDTQSRSDRAFSVELSISGLPWPQAYVNEYRFDKTNNTFYNYAKQLGERSSYSVAEVDQLQYLSQLRVTGSSLLAPTSGNLTITANLLSNGINYLVISRQPIQSRVEDWLEY